MPQKVVIEQEDLPSELMLDGVDTSGGPTFEPAEVAKIFFALSPHWIRWREGQGHMTYQGKIVGARNERGARYYDLAAIERMIYALLEHDAITAERGLRALNIVRDIALVHGYIVFDEPPLGA